MPLNITQVATAAVTALAPFTPYLLELGKAGGKKLVEVIAEKGGEAAWQKAQTIWGKLKNRFGEDPEVTSATTLIAVDPEDEDRQATLIKVLSERLEDDQNLAQELFDLLGGQERIQEMVADQGSLMLKVSQKMKGSGKQVMQARGKSKIIGGKQEIE